MMMTKTDINRGGAMMSAIALLLATIALVGCGKARQFEIELSVSGMPTQNLEFIYDNGISINRAVATLLDGKTTVTGSSAEPCVVEVFTGSGIALGRTVAVNGDKIKWNIIPDSPASSTVTGNETAEALQQWLAANLTGDTIAFNSRIAAAVSRDPASALSRILAGYYYVACDGDTVPSDLVSRLKQADNSDSRIDALARQCVSLGILSHQVEPFDLLVPGDSMVTIDLAGRQFTLLYIAAPERRADTLACHLTRKDLGEASLIVVRTAFDTIFWHDDRNKYMVSGTRHGWAPGGPAWPGLTALSPGALPWCVVTDSTAATLYAGRSLDAALGVLKSPTDTDR